MTIHSLELKYTVFASDAVDALITWGEFYADCARFKFSLDGIRSCLRYWYPKLCKQIAEEREIRVDQINNPTPTFWDVCAKELYDHYREEREAL